ncbi:MAG: TIGR01212 family radical SAM protein [bacterium]
MLYRSYSDYLKERYGEKVYKLPVNLPVSCPNRDGNLGVGGCIFCGAQGAGFEDLSNTLSVKEQLQKNKLYIGQRYKAKKFIAYLQNFTNTYLPLKVLKKYLEEITDQDIVEVAVSTRPDCLSDAYLDCFLQYGKEQGKNISLELGLQTVNYHTLAKINRGHGLAEFIDAVLRLKKYDFVSCVHLILDLPWDDRRDVVEMARIISALQIEQVKLHSLYVVKGSALAESYLAGNLTLLSKEEYIARVMLFLENLDSRVVVQRLIGRAPKEDTLIANWNTSWWKIKEEIEEKMRANDTYQGKYCDYLNGAALRIF